ncbi:MAG: RagB/SusD family nutrient uptake outer membrane protein [Chitinophagaceae bacterium]|nr:RagB/SusD family nutrient uptake outer membrane protein [Chitinophagaceae bacterium]
MKSIYIILLVTCVFGCSKSEFLNKKPDESISQPSTLEEFQAILDKDELMNGGIGRFAGVDPSFLITGTDDHFIPEFNLSFLPIEAQNLYVWSDDIYGLKFNDWNQVYKAIFYANVVLDGLQNIDITMDNEFNYKAIKGAALFFRGRFYFQLAQIYAPQYNLATANSDWGLILRLISDINEPLYRSTVQQTYLQILKDLKDASELLPVQNPSLYKTRPTKAASFAMLAKSYLVMGDYVNAKLYADSCLDLHSTLMDFNTSFNPMPTLTSSGFPIPRGNTEVIFHSMIYDALTPTIGQSTVRIDSLLYRSYGSNDLRKSTFFRNPSSTNVFFKGSYDGTNWYFSGIAVDEVYLIRAEAYARTNYINEAMNDLNTLLITRFKNDGSFVPIIATTQSEAIQIILKERRKELIQRGTRWSDLRRLNKDGANIVIERKINGVSYFLDPNDKRYTFLIPPDIISFNPTMPQNPR